MISTFRNTITRTPALALPLLRLYGLTKGVSLRGVQGDPPKIGLRRGDKEIWLRRSHYAYVADVILNFDYYFDAVMPSEAADATRVVDYSTPRDHTLNGSKLVMRFTALAEPDATTDIYLQCSRLKPAATVWDLGTYCGASTILFARTVGQEGMVYGFEPDEANFAALRVNLERHRCTNVLVFSKAVWSHATTLQFEAEGSMGSAAHGAGVHQRRSATRSVEAVPLDQVAAVVGRAAVDVVKMDIEGAELACLEAAGRGFWDLRPQMVIEPHMNNGKVNTPALEAILRRNDYATAVLPQAGLHLPLILATPND
jgi:FkbM family methyltransferase